MEAVPSGSQRAPTFSADNRYSGELGTNLVSICLRTDESARAYRDALPERGSAFFACESGLGRTRINACRGRPRLPPFVSDRSSSRPARLASLSSMKRAVPAPGTGRRRNRSPNRSFKVTGSRLRIEIGAKSATHSRPWKKKSVRRSNGFRRPAKIREGERGARAPANIPTGVCRVYV